MAATCRVCAIGYEVWPGVCPNCGCSEAAPEPQEPPVPPATGRPPVDPADVGPEPAPDYASWTVGELRDECDRRGLPTSGVKAVLVARLEGG